VLFISTRPLHYYQLLPGCCLLIDIHYCTLRLHNPLRAVLRYKSGISRSTSATRHRHRPDRLSHSRGLSSQTLSWVSERQPKQKNERRLRTLRHPPSAIAINTGVFSEHDRWSSSSSSIAHLLLLAARTTSTPPTVSRRWRNHLYVHPPHPSLFHSGRPSSYRTRHSTLSYTLIPVSQFQVVAKDVSSKYKLGFLIRSDIDDIDIDETRRDGDEDEND
jgi:hypothetical protein